MRQTVSAQRRARPRGSGALAAGVLTSAVLHWVILSFPLRPATSHPARPDQPAATVESARLRLITLHIADPLLPVAQPLRRTAPQDNPSPAPTVTQPGEPTAEEPSGREVVPTVAERLMARPLPALLELPRSATVEAAARLRGEVATFNDSITEVQNRGALPSWTAAESDGDRWGFSPGRIHLGRHTVSPCEDFALLRITVVLDPFTCQFRMQDAHRRELRDRVDLHREIQIRSGLIEADEQVRRRIRAMNARAAAARDTIPR